MAIFPFWVGERRGEAFGWTETYLFVYLIGKRAYISNETNQTSKEEISIFPFWVGGKGKGKPP